ncbi:MAG: hypothetical protein VX700_02610 [Pseudomonadota bacterium]|nr:hypothetical protein [Pseudomonadota bacterium]
MPSCEIITDPDQCERLWLDSRDIALPFGDWSLRMGAARMSDITPYFLRHVATGTVLPLGLAGDMAVFFGGKVYSERNGFLGPSGGEADILEALVETGRSFRLLSWVCDPVALTSSAMAAFEVPYNQFWIADPFHDMEAYSQSRLEAKHVKEFRYLQRKFTYIDLVPENWVECAEKIETYIKLTMQSFAKRNAHSVYSDEVARAIILETCKNAFARNALRMTELEYNEECCGLAVFIDECEAERATYLLNLYAPSPSDISNGVICAVIRYASASGKPVDGLRGSFTLKKKFGFRPEPAFALVRDPNWIVKPQSDLSPSEILTLYGRPFWGEK